ncbi:unnamed protein product [Acanthoscelides obtectus]|uniref:Uncharacterized protein n=1 Tax=Acanthoscelides obtectus TaxID=200917 RepID=A0A9P0MBC9_ACAOB|nr:unnamed protein product [Acanthoscelides obtectus]CAK1688191.1 hypothetical protein AOBTE_LOCUS36594 [Acanthoscelides obtectus]
MCVIASTPINAAYGMLRIVIHKSRCYRIPMSDRKILFLDLI